MLRRFLAKVRAKLAGSAGKTAAHEAHSTAPAAHAVQQPAPQQPGQRRRRRRGGRGRGPRPGAALAPAAHPSRQQPAQAAAAAPQAPWTPESWHVPPVEGKKRFHDFALPYEIMHAVADLQYDYCTPVQAEILPALLDGKDATGRAQTGTGKTAAFLIGMFAGFLRRPIQGLRRPGRPRALVLAPTRELVVQIDKEAAALAKYAPIRIAAAFGGIDYERQRRRLSEPVDLLIATPGRLLDYLGSRHVRLDGVEILVIDEADRMLDMGFIPDVERIVRQTAPKAERRTWLFSATLTGEVRRIASRWMQDPVVVEIDPEQVAVDTVEQTFYIVTAAQKFTLLYNIIKNGGVSRALVFVNRRDCAEWLASQLKRCGIGCGVLSGALSQEQRLRTLDAFRTGALSVVVATDVAGRGLHIEDISHVINYNLPFEPEDYVHRIGRTGRAGASGVSISFACDEDSFVLPEIEKFVGRGFAYAYPPEEWLRPPSQDFRLEPLRRAPAQSRGGFGRRGFGGRDGRARRP